MLAFLPIQVISLILHSAHEDKIGYQDKSPIFYRYHDNSLSIYSQDVESYVTSQYVLLDELKSIFFNGKITFINRKLLTINVFKMLIDHYYTISLRSSKNKYSTYRYFLKY